jgi:NTE family protein
MARKIVLVLQGGGALGAFECGVWKALAPLIREQGHELVAVAGASIGAVNAALIVRNYHEDDAGAGALVSFWRDRLAVPPLPFIGLPGEYWRAWNGLLTGLLVGNRSLFTPMYQNWNIAGSMARFALPLYQTGNAVRTMSEVFGEYHGDKPLLLTAATDVKTGEAVLFDSMTGTITPEMIVASTSIPILFPPARIDGRYFWDPEMRGNTLLPDLLEWLVRSMPAPAEQLQDYLVVMVDMFSPSTDDLPQSVMQSAYRLMNIVIGTKSRYDRREFEAGNAHIDALERLRALSGDGASPALKNAIDDEYRKVVAERRARVEFIHVGRGNLPNEHISRDFDFSPQYIDSLIEQGAERLRTAFAGRAGEPAAPITQTAPAPGMRELSA